MLQGETFPVNQSMTENVSLRGYGSPTGCYVLSAPADFSIKCFIIIRLRRLQPPIRVAYNWYDFCSSKSVLWHYNLLKEKA